MRYTVYMQKQLLILTALLITPGITHAQSVQDFLVSIVKFFNDTVIPFLIGVGFLFFAINTIRYFVIGGSNEKEQEKAKALALYGVLAFIIIITFWGIVNVLVDGIGLGEGTQPKQDYVDLKGG